MKNVRSPGFPNIRRHLKNNFHLSYRNGWKGFLAGWGVKCGLVICMMALAGCAVSQNDFQRELLMNLPAGVRTNMLLDIPAGDKDPATFIPVSVIKGVTEGPTLLLVAGVHGYEFAPILAANRLAQDLDPALLSGTVIIVKTAHIAAFEARVPYVNPYDRKNLNRSFPGTPAGTQTERIAWALSSEIIPAADFVLDVHSGDGAEWLEAFVGVYGGPLATDYTKAFKFAEAMGFPNIVRYQMNTQKQLDQGRSLNRQAVVQGLPTLLVEIGENGRRDEDHVMAIVTGIKHGLASLGMLPAPIDDLPSPRRYFEGTRSVTANMSGVWMPSATTGRTLINGETLGIVQDYQGNIVETIKSPVAGYALYGLAGPPVRAGEAIITIGNLSTRDMLTAAR